MDMEIKIIDIATATSEELIETLDENNKTASLMLEEIKKLKAIAGEEREIIIENTSSFPEPLQEEEEEDSLEDELGYYIENFNNASLEELEENSDDILPSPENPNYQNIILRIKIELLKAIREINEIIKTTEKTNKEELEYYK